MRVLATVGPSERIIESAALGLSAALGTGGVVIHPH